MFWRHTILGTTETISFLIIVLFSLYSLYIVCRVGITIQHKLQEVLLSFDGKFCALIWLFTMFLQHLGGQSSPGFLIPAGAIPRDTLFFFPRHPLTYSISKYGRMSWHVGSWRLTSGGTMLNWVHVISVI